MPSQLARHYTCRQLSHFRAAVVQTFPQDHFGRRGVGGCVSLLILPLSWYLEELHYQPDLLLLLHDEGFILLDVKLGCVQHVPPEDKPHHREVQCLQRISEPSALLLLQPHPGSLHVYPGPAELIEKLSMEKLGAYRKLLSFWGFSCCSTLCPD